MKTKKRKKPIFEVDKITEYICELQLYDQVNSTYIDFDLWDRQRELNALIEYERLIIILKKRQVGASQLVGANSLIHCFFEWNFSCLILSKTGNQEGGDAKVFLERIRGMYASIPDIDSLFDMFDSGKVVSKYLVTLVLGKDFNPCIKGSESGVAMRFLNGSYLLSLPASKGRGHSVKRIVVDEAAFIKPDPSNITLSKLFENIFAAVEKSQGQLILISTANGLDEFADLYVKSENGESSFVHFFFSCYDDPTFTKSMREQIIIDFGENHANQEYPENPEQAFIASGSCRFDRKAMAHYEEKSKTVQILIKGDVQILDSRDSVIPLDIKNPPFQTFAKRNDRACYLVTADVAEGLVIGDYSVAKVFNRLTWQQIAEYRDHIEPKEFGTVISVLGRIYNNAVLAVESNNHGHSTLTRILDTEKYPEELIFAHGILQTEGFDDELTGRTRWGWMTTKKNRLVIINNLAQMILDKEIPNFTPFDMKELRTFIRKKGGKVEAESGFYDDRVIANAIAFFLMSNDIFNSYFPLMNFNEYQKCRFCNHFDTHRNGYGLCKKSGRYSADEQCCILFAKIRFQTTEIERQSQSAYMSGYIPLSR